jgi:hypothetical protein
VIDETFLKDKFDNMDQIIKEAYRRAREICRMDMRIRDLDSESYDNHVLETTKMLIRLYTSK